MQSFTVQCGNAGIVNYMKQQQGPPSKELMNLKEVKGHMKSGDVTVVGFFKNSEETHFQIYENAGLYWDTQRKCHSSHILDSWVLYNTDGLYEFSQQIYFYTADFEN